MIMINKIKSFLQSISNKRWMISIVAIVQYFWSFAFSINFFISFIAFYSDKGVSQRNLFIFLFLFFLMVFVLVFTSDVRWKAFLKMFFYTLGLVSTLMMLVSFSLTFKYFFVGVIDVSLVFAAACLIFGVFGYFLSYKALKAKYLN